MINKFIRAYNNGVADSSFVPPIHQPPHVSIRGACSDKTLSSILGWFILPLYGFLFISQSRNICFVGPELTVPIEERIAFWNEKKTGKYQKMIADHRSPSWKLKCIVAEVGCRGYIPPSFRNTLQLHSLRSN